MNEEAHKIDVDVVNEEEASEVKEEVRDEMAELGAALGNVVKEGVNFIEALSNALMNSTQDVTGMMVIKADKELRQQLDLLVEAGVAKNRIQAAEMLLEEGAETREELFEKIRSTHRRIVELREQMRNLVTT